jgi:hypothetical protein
VWPRWAKPFPIELIEAEWETIPATSGIYVIMTRKPIRRVGGFDRRGILYVGKAIVLRERLDKFWNADHIASDFLRMNLSVAEIILRKKMTKEDDLYPLLAKLYARIATPIKRGKELDMAERAILFAYMNRFGELPPLNFSIRARWKDKPSKDDLRWAGKTII